ncbi:MAG: tetratricopeptide repeat protein [Verrucomicrobiaceae bacterium]|nr:MAG: tetratricopeptide repeat protein [Verrucomicrobiaceae bacterium]
MSGDLLQRARLLCDRKRFDDAIVMLHEYLASQPESFAAYYELAVTRLLGEVDYRQGLDDITRALSIFPDSAAAHSVRSALLHASERYQDALLAAGEAKRLDPELAYAWFCEGNALLGMNAFPGAERAARKALELDPNHPSAPNLLNAALRLQKRYGEAEEVTDRHFERNPEDPWAFAAAGWTALRQGQHGKAEGLFREALRLRPGLEAARLGWREAYKGRSVSYRLYLRHMSLLQRQTEWYKVLGVVGMVVAFLSVVAILATAHPLAAVSFVVSFSWVFGAWIGSSFGNLLILKDPLARLSLNRQEVLDGLVAGFLVAGGVLVLVLGAWFKSRGVAALGGTMMGASVPGSFAFINPSTSGRMVFGLMSLSIVACGVVALLYGPDQPVGCVSIIAAMLAVFVTPRIAMIPSLRKKKPA